MWPTMRHILIYPATRARVAGRSVCHTSIRDAQEAALGSKLRTRAGWPLGVALGKRGSLTLES